MMIYKLLPKPTEGYQNVFRISDSTSIPFDPDNTDYQNFKKQINADEAQLEDADGNVMSADKAKQFIKELP